MTIAIDAIPEFIARHNYCTWRRRAGWMPLHITAAEGCYFSLADGRRILDLSAQAMCVNLGHNNPAIRDAIIQQSRTLSYVYPAFATEIRARATEKLLEVMPTGLEMFFFSTSGAEANEAAFKIARMVTGRHKIIARYNAYHGSTPGAMAATGDQRRWFAEPAGTMPGVIHAPEVNCYRCPLKQTYPDCGVACADYIEYMLENEGNVAAVIVEPVVGTNGVLVPPAEYLPRLRALCDRHEVLLIFDEVMSGWGRTGAWFACQHWDTLPDILTTAKGATNAAMPLGITATTRRIGDHFQDHVFAHGHTYEAHPMALSPVPAAIDEARRLDLPARARELGGYLGERLRALQDRHPAVGDVRGKGLFWAVELVRDRDTRTPFASKHDKAAGKPLLVERLHAELLNRGVYCLPWISHLVLAPPLIIQQADIDLAVAALDEVLAIADDVRQA